MTPVEAAARDARAAGLSVVPPVEDGTKRPDAAWKRYQSERADAAQLDAWYADGQRGGLGTVCGRVSGNLECFEIENQRTEADLMALAEAGGLGPLVRYITEGYSERTPGGGVHWLYRCEEIAGNTKLARRTDPTTGEIEVLIETRGEGGFVILAPSNGTVHPTGGAYRLLSGGFDLIATISIKARTELHRMARAFDDIPKDTPAPAREPSPVGGGLRPGDDYNAKTTWAELLEAEGWVHVYRQGDVSHWRRPGKDQGISATTNYGGSDLLWVFSTSTVFDAERSYDRFGAYAALRHGGDLAEAGKALRREGYGEATTRLIIPEGKRADNADEEGALFVLPDAVRHGPIGEYIGLVSPTTEAPDALILGGFLAVLSASVARRVRVDYARPLYPNLFICIVGATGFSRKDHAIDAALDAMTFLPTSGKRAEVPFDVISDVSSAEGLVKDLESSPKMLLRLRELSLLLDNAQRKGTRTITDKLIELWDTPPETANRSKMNGRVVKDPYLCAVAPTQPDRLERKMGEEDMYSGFANRWLYIFGGEDKDAMPRPPRVNTVAAAAIVQAFLASCARLAGRVLMLEDEAGPRWDKWYTRTKAEAKADPIGGAMRARCHPMAMKLALLYAIADDADTVGLAHLEAGIALTDWSWSHLKKSIYGWGAGDEVRLERRVVEVLAERGAMKRWRLAHFCKRPSWPQTMFHKVVQAMAASGIIVINQDSIVALREQMEGAER